MKKGILGLFLLFICLPFTSTVLAKHPDKPLSVDLKNLKI